MTQQQFLSHLPEGIREMAEEGIKSFGTEDIYLAWKNGSVANYLDQAFVWSSTPEGQDFWDGVYHELKHIENNKP